MPHAEYETVRYGDAADVASDTQTGRATLTPAGGVTAVPVLGLGTNTLNFSDGAALKATADEAKAKIAADPTKGFSLDIVDDPGTDSDPERIEYQETSGVVRVYATVNTSHPYTPAGFDGLIAGLELLGL